jgi:peptidoglycan/xylan/chitin deacetylase (PgdA/CDA1 family)
MDRAPIRYSRRGYPVATILFGYDVEICDPARAHLTREFLVTAEKVHRETGAPCTMFLCGKTLEMSQEAFRELADHPLIEFQSHTYAHSLLKTDVQWIGGRQIGDPKAGKVRILRGASVEQIRAEVRKTKELLKEILGVDNTGLRAPTGCYMGLFDRPELLDIFQDLGIQYTSCYHLSPEDFLHWQVHPLDVEKVVQPFWYSQVAQLRGYAPAPGEAELPPTLPHILEFPVHAGAIDCVWKDMFGYDAYGAYLNSIKVIIDIVARENLVLSYAQHDWSSIKGDPEMDTTRAILEYAQQKGVEVLTHGAFYERALGQEAVAVAS